MATVEREQELMDSSTTQTEFESSLKYTISERGYDLDTLSREKPTLVVFLRHLGCTFCREALADLAAVRRQIEQLGVQLALVHMGPPEEAEAQFTRNGLGDIVRFCDPDRALYKTFGLKRATVRQAFGLKSLVRGVKAGIFARHGLGRIFGDAMQMPGVFLVHNGEIVESYLHQTVSDRPHYLDIAATECTR
jgi:peroxiredoxin